MSFSKKCLLFLVSVFALSASWGQQGSVRGLVSSGSGETLVAATVQVGEWGTITDFEGAYSLNLPAGNHLLTVSYVGFQPQSLPVMIKAGEVTELNVVLAEEPTLLQTATVTSGKYEKALGELTVSLEVLRPSLIENTGKVSLDEALQKVPGLTIIDGSANIRGGSGYSQGAGSRVLLLVDDVPILQADAGYPNWGDVPVESIEQVEVLKGAASALYGSSALNGIINVRTAYARNEPETKAAVFATSYLSPADERLKWWDDAGSEASPYSAGASISHRRKIGKLDLVAGGFYLNEESYRKDNFQRYGRANFNLRYRASDRLNYGLAGNVNSGQSGSYFYWISDTAAYIGHPTTLARSSRLRYNLDPFVNYYDASGNRHRFLGRMYSVDNKNNRNQSNQSYSWYGEYQFHRRFVMSDAALTAGIVGLATSVNAELYGDTTFSSRNLAAYVQLEKKFFERLNVSAGFRYERNLLINPGFENPSGPIAAAEEREDKPVFRVGLNYELAKATFLRASWGQGYRFPTVAEKFIYTDAGGFFVVPNPSLGSETGWSAEAGIKQGFRLGGFEGFLDLAAFLMRYQDMIEFNYTIGAFQSVNIGGTDIRGLEVTAAGQGRIGKLPLRLLGGYTIIDPTFLEWDPTPPVGLDRSQGQLNFQNSSNRETNVLKYRFRHSVKFDLETNFNKFYVGAEVFYLSRIEAVDFIFNLIVPGLKNFQDANPDGFWYSNFRFAYKPSDELRISLLLGNAFNRAYTIRPALMEPPRNITLRTDWRFGGRSKS